MARITGHNRDQAGSGDLCRAVNRHLQLSLNYFVNLFLGMEVLVNRRAALEVVMREGHVRGVEIASVPPRKAFGDFQTVDVNEGHLDFPQEGNPSTELVLRIPVQPAGSHHLSNQLRMSNEGEDEDETILVKRVT